MSPEFTLEDYIRSFENQYRVDMQKEKIPPGHRWLLELADLNGRLLFARWQPYEPGEWQNLSNQIKEAKGFERIQLMLEQGLLRDRDLKEVGVKTAIQPVSVLAVV